MAPTVLGRLPHGTTCTRPGRCTTRHIIVTRAQCPFFLLRRGRPGNKRVVAASAAQPPGSDQPHGDAAQPPPAHAHATTITYALRESIRRAVVASLPAVAFAGLLLASCAAPPAAVCGDCAAAAAAAPAHHMGPASASAAAHAAASSAPSLAPAATPVAEAAPPTDGPSTAAMDREGNGASVAASDDAGGGAAAGGDVVANALEDGLLEAVKQLEAGIDSTLSRAPLPLGLAASEQEAASATAATHLLASEVWGVVESNFLDARSGGFDRARWAALRDEVLATSYRDRYSGYRAVRAMIAKGLRDPYSRFLTPAEFSGMAKYDVTGVGLNLGTAEEFVRKTGLALPAGRDDGGGGVWVVGMIRGSAAESAGVAQGDELLEVGGRPVDPFSPFQVASLISGQAGSSGSDSADEGAPVSVKVRRWDGSLAEVSVSRPARTLRSPVTYRIESGRGGSRVGYLRLSSFNARAQSDVAAALAALAEGGVGSLVLDLTDNRGGLVTEGVEVAKLFLYGDSTVVQQLGQGGAAVQRVTARGSPVTSVPLTVLVNGGTASASEILAGALQDNCRAVLVGKRTYGKGLIQSVYELSDGSGMVLTVGKYLTPRGTDIDRGGLKPDFKSLPSDAAAAAALQACAVAAR